LLCDLADLEVLLGHFENVVIDTAERGAGVVRLRPPVREPDPADPPGDAGPGPGGPVEAPRPVEAWVEPPAVRHARERFTAVQCRFSPGSPAAARPSNQDQSCQPGRGWHDRHD
jgi:hypothetical protein